MRAEDSLYSIPTGCEDGGCTMRSGSARGRGTLGHATPLSKHPAGMRHPEAEYPLGVSFQAGLGRPYDVGKARYRLDSSVRKERAP